MKIFKFRLLEIYGAIDGNQIYSRMFFLQLISSSLQKTHCSITQQCYYSSEDVADSFLYIFTCMSSSLIILYLYFYTLIRELFIRNNWLVFRHFCLQKFKPVVFAFMRPFLFFFLFCLLYFWWMNQAEGSSHSF